MRLSIIPGDGLPIYRQIVRQVVDAIAAGRLAAGEKLDSHRELACELVIAPMTVKKAYDELERAGYVKTRQGLGTFVTARATPLGEEARLERLRPPARQLVGEAELMALRFASVVELLRAERARLKEGQQQARTGTGGARGRS